MMVEGSSRRATSQEGATRGSMKIDYCVRRSGDERVGGSGYVNVGQRLADYLGMSLHICMQLYAGK
jgi:hypothetical protein